jgi:hypothetical protein
MARPGDRSAAANRVGTLQKLAVQIALGATNRRMASERLRD